MSDKMNNKAFEAEVDSLPGVAIDAADDCKDTKRLQKERTRTLDDNPRDNDLDE